MIDIDIRFAKDEQVRRVESIPLVVTVKIEQTVFPDALDLREFFLSLTRGGLRPLFTCAVCGTFGCEGYYALIEHTPQSYIINGTYTYLDPRRPIYTTRYEIPWWQITKMLRQLREAIVSIPYNYPHLEKYISTGWIPSLDEIDKAIILATQLNRLE